MRETNSVANIPLFQSVLIHPSETLFLSLHRDNAKLWSLPSFEQKPFFSRRDSLACFLSDGRHLLSSFDRSLRVCNSPFPSLPHVIHTSH